MDWLRFLAMCPFVRASFGCFLLSLYNEMFYNKRSLLFNIMPGSGRSFIMQLLFVPLSLHGSAIRRKGEFHGILKNWNFERCITWNEKFIKLVFPTVEDIHTHTHTHTETHCTMHIRSEKFYTVVLNFSERNNIIALTTVRLVLVWA